MSLGHVAIVGGGRWARVIASVLTESVAGDHTVSLHTRRGFDACAGWARARGDARVQVAREWPTVRPDAVIVANAARDHLAAAERAVEAGLPVLVEKPLGLDAARAGALVARARERDVVLATGHVFLFAPLLSAFAERVAARGGPRAMALTWTDPAAEVRHGERKSYDASIDVVEDVLAHAHSIGWAMSGALGVIDAADAPATLTRDGKEARLTLRFDGAPLALTLAREAPARARRLEVTLADGRASIDFTVEPGTIVEDGAPVHVEVPRSPGPLARMLGRFLDAAAGAPLDPRLDPAVGLQACALIAQARG